MRDDLDGTVYPKGQHETLEEATNYAIKRTGEKRCEMEVLGEYGENLGKYRNGTLLADPNVN